MSATARLAEEKGQRPLSVLFFLDYEDSLGARFANSPGLLPLIGHTRAQGFDIDFVSSERELLNRLGAEAVDVVAISSMERLLPRSVEVARRARALRPQAVLMIGGNAIDPFAVDLVSSLFDIVVLGEAEHIFPSLLHAIARARGRPRSVHSDAAIVSGSDKQIGPSDAGPGLDSRTVDLIRVACFERQLGPGLPVRIRIGNTYVRDAEQNVVWYLNEPDSEDLAAASPVSVEKLDRRRIGVMLGSAPLAAELDEFCIEPWDILRREGWKHFEFYAQRGCRWGRCTFCSVSSREVRAQSPEKVIEIIREAVTNGAEMISFADDLFVQHRDWNVAVLEGIIAAQLRNVEFRAQTMATASVWPLLHLMKRAGFSEIAFGVETVSPSRASFMAKSHNGNKYVSNAKETIIRVANAGINPVLYMIMVDPRSTLLEIATELHDIVELCFDVFRMTRVVPKISHSLMMLPVASTSITAVFAYSTETVDLGTRQIAMPTEFKVDPDVAAYLSAIGRRTEAMPKRRENLAAFEHYFEELVRVAHVHQRPDGDRIAEVVKRGQALLDALTSEIDLAIDTITRSVAGLAKGERQPDFDTRWLDYRWLGGHVRGIERFACSISQVHG